MNTRFLRVALPLCILTAGCMPSADFKVSLRVVDDETGKPIPDALVLAGAYLTVAPAMEPPYNRPVAAARGMTDAEGRLRLGRVEGMYVGEKPQDKFYKMLESREPKVKYNITGIEGGSILVFAPGYGVTEQPFQVEGESKEGRKYSWLGDPQDPWYKSPLTLKSREIRQGTRLTLRISKPKDFDQAYKAFDFDTVIWTLNLTNRDTGTTQKEKDMVWGFFEKQIRYAVWTSTNPYYERQLEKFKDPKTKADFDSLAFSGTDADAALQLWMTQKALEILPAEQDEVKEYAQAILAGVRAEGEGPRSRNHYYDGVPAEGQPALRWGAIGYPDNPDNEWDWEDAQRYYQEGDKTKAYRALGHVLRLLENMAVPKYAKAVQGDGFDNSIAGLMQKTGGSLPPEYWQEALQPKFAKTQRERFDDIAQRTRALSAGLLEARMPGGAVTNGDSGSAWESVAKKSIPPAIAQAAGLLQGFHRLMHPAVFVQMPGKGGNGGDKPGHEVASSSAAAVQSTNQAEAGLKKHMRFTPIKGSRKIDIHPIGQSQGITTGLVIAYGHVIRPPYKVEFQGRRLMVNGVQVEPSLLLEREEARNRLPPPTQAQRDAERRLMWTVRLAYELYVEGVKTKSLETVQDEVIRFLDKSSDVFHDPKWTGATTLSVDLAGDGSVPLGLDFSEEPLSEPPTEEYLEKRYGEGERKAREQMLSWIVGDLRRGHSVTFKSTGGQQIGGDVRAKVRRIMAETELSREQRIERLREDVFRHYYDPALDVVDNYDPVEWEVK